MNADGSNQIQLTKGRPKFYPSISGDGKWVLFNSTDDLHLWKVSVDGGDPIEVASYVAIRPSMSPDQRSIVCLGRNGSKREILILPAAGGEPLKRIEVRAPRLAGYRIKWTADGKALIYIAENDGTLNIMSSHWMAGLRKKSQGSIKMMYSISITPRPDNSLSLAGSGSGTWS